ncbi:macro domain-containing protein [Mucilaginibacter sp. BJC16-A38]|uniref:macro domain-containing protein n=1 Tax=Mucilaginibacter phenanthrenivorans TaxID=1234842 RepID=UPI00215807D9|nr:macro domain-containing protein [Mucilaginibacter phenanthrenivorans]MCR8556476.1 macro domain-containing protein [Mucilaginibacter phenanthrenivorans]
MIKILYGDIFQSNAYALVNTVNTVGVMGKGIALQFKNEFPYNYQRYREACLNHELQVGKLLSVKDRSLHLSERLIINFQTKTHWRLPSEYTYIEQGLQDLVRLMNETDIGHIALPALGCGNNGLDWYIVKQLINQYLAHIEAKIEAYQPS